MKRHPVYFFLPSVPVPESHCVGEGTVVEIVAQFEVGLVALLLLDGWQYCWQFGVHAVPCDMDAGIMLQIPVDAHGNIHPGVAPDDDGIVSTGRLGCCCILSASSLVYLEEIFVRLDKYCLELGSSSLVYAIQKIVCRICVCTKSNST